MADVIGPLELRPLDGTADATGLRRTWSMYRRSVPGLVGLTTITILVGMAIIAPALLPYGPSLIGVGPVFDPPSLEFPMGTDNLGRDELARFVAGAQVSLFVGIAAATASNLFGLLVGAIAGYVGGLLDELLMRVTEIFQTVPRFFLAVVIIAFFGASVANIVIAIAVLSWPITARLARAEYTGLRSRQFIDAARVVGASHRRIAFVEILPNAASPVIVVGTLQVAQAMLIEAGLSYLGLGDPATVSWGLMLYQAQPVLRDAWWMAVFPGLGILLAVLSFNLIGDAINDALNPRLHER